MNSVMLDFETFGNGKNACVTQIGACYFDELTGEIGATYKCNVDARSAQASGADLDADTVYWWLKQDPKAIASMIADPLVDIRQAFIELNDFLSNAKSVWSHSTFDFVILQETLKRLGIKPSFRFSVARDIRTLGHLAGGKKPTVQREGTHHDALDDCFYQVAYCCEALRKIQDARIDNSACC